MLNTVPKQGFVEREREKNQKHHFFENLRESKKFEIHSGGPVMKKPGDVENNNQFKPLENELLKGLKVTKVEDPILEHRLLVRKIVKKMEPEYSVVLAFLPLALSFSYFLMSKMSSGTSEPIFTKNLPIFTNFKPKIHFDTWSYIIKSNFDGQPPKTNLLLGQPEFIGKIKNRESLDRDGLTGLSCSSFDLRLQNKLLKNGQPLILDELPAYLEGVTLIHETETLETETPENEIPTSETLTSAPLEIELFPSETLETETLPDKSLTIESFENQRVDSIALENQIPQTELLESGPSAEFLNSVPQTTKLKQVKTFRAKKSPGSFFLSDLSSDERELTLFEKRVQAKTLSNPTSSPFPNKGVLGNKKSPLITSLFSTNRAKLAKLVDKLDKQFLVDFIETNNFQADLDAEKILSVEERKTDVLSGHLRDIADVDLIDDIVDFFEERPTYPRLMSGYIYPDTSRQELEWFYKQKSQGFFGKHSPVRYVLPDLKENLLGLDVSTIKYNFVVNKLPRFSVETQEVEVQSRDRQNSLYEGPGLVLDSERALDWKVSGKLRSWFHKYLSPLNPLYQKQENFFGAWKSPGISSRSLALAELEEQNRDIFIKRLKYVKKNDKETRWGTSLSLAYNPRFAPYKVELYIPAEPEKWGGKGIFIAPKNSDIEKYPELNLELEGQNPEDQPSSMRPRYTLKDQAALDFLPLVDVSMPASRSFSPTKDSKNGYSPVFNLGITANSDYSFTPNVFDYISPQRAERYIKRVSIYSKRSLFSRLFIRLKVELARFVPLPAKWLKTSQRTQVSNWEPLTSQSWLIVSQITFAVVFFYALKGLASTYGEEVLEYLLELIRVLPFVPEMMKEHIIFLTGGRTDTGYRLIWNSPKRFAELRGVGDVLLQLDEVISFLRAQGPPGLLRRVIPRGILLYGSPGTGKSTLVQAIAGETRVPIILMSGSSLIGPERTAGRRLRELFEEAHAIAPCIIFIDELDTIGWKRTEVLHKDPTKRNIVGPWDMSIIPAEFKETVHFQDYYESPIDKLQKLEEQREREEELREKGKYYIEESEDNTHQLSLLVELLIQMDGLTENSAQTQVVVFGATNHPENLDPALLRPGRFDRFIHVKRPRENERIEILKLYSRDIGYEANIPWKYLAARTEGFSGADLYTLVNGSAMKIITSEKYAIHTLRTLEAGIELISTKRSLKHKALKQTQKKKGRPDLLKTRIKLDVIRFAYYQAGKTLVSYLLETHPNPAAATLWPPRVESTRLLQLKEMVRRRIEASPITHIYERIIACYAGKAAEYLFITRFSRVQSQNLSGLGLNDVRFAHHLTYYLVEHLTIYTDKFRKLRVFPTLENRNSLDSHNIVQREKFLADLSNHEGNIRKRVKDYITELRGIVKLPGQREADKRKTPMLRPKQRYEEWLLWNDDIPETMWLDLIMEDWEGPFPENKSKIWWKNPVIIWPDVHYHTRSGERNALGMGRLVRRPSKLYTNSLKELSSGESAQTREEKLQFPSQETEKQLPPQTSGGVKEGIAQESQKESESSKSQKPQEPSKFPNVSKKKRVFMSWNEYPTEIRDYPVQSLVLQSFNKALVILNQNREILDRIVVDLLYNEIVRQPELEKYIQEFYPNYSPNQTEDVDDSFIFEKPKGLKILKPSWGVKSRRPLPRWIDFSAFESSEKK